jgi:mono/diheme cytochrome c family protein
MRSRERAGCAAVSCVRRALALACACAPAFACHGDMVDQARYESFSPSSRWPDGTSARPIPAGTIARDAEAFEAPPPAGAADRLPFVLTQAGIERGRERYGIYCAPCHGALGDGRGMIVQRGFQQPPTFHQERLRAAPYRHFYQTISRGIGAMGEYGSDVPPHDRWLIAAFIRALQRSQSVPIEELPETQRAELARSGR